MVIREIMQTYQGVYQITPMTGSAFFLRISYLSHVTEDQLFSGAELSDEQMEDVMNAALIYSAETAAMTYLNRSEHCRFQLAQKLIKKGIDKQALNTALDYLQECSYLDDERFAGAWLRTRAINHFEGRTRLSAELASRGVEKAAAVKALNDFFNDNDEYELCLQALKKCISIKTPQKKIKNSLIQKGFSLKHIDMAVKELQQE